MEILFDYLLNVRNSLIPIPNVDFESLLVREWVGAAAALTCRVGVWWVYRVCSVAMFRSLILPLRSGLFRSQNEN